MANRIYLDTDAFESLLHVPHHGRDIAQHTLFDDADLTETADGCAPAGIGQNQIEFERRMEALRVAEISGLLSTHPDEDHHAYLQLKNLRLKKRVIVNKQTAEQRERALTEAVENAVEELRQAQPSHVAPPVNAQFLLDLFLPESRCEEFLGDLQERYSKKLPRLGKARADWWYRKQVLTSLWPLACGFTRHAGKSTILRIVTFLLRLVGLAAWADALKRIADAGKQRVD